jgi:hypothetical protein
MWLRDTQVRVTALTAALLLAMSAAYSQEDLREAAQNPIADLISLPLQNNMNFGIGDTDNIQNVLNVQPVYPTRLNDGWNLITRPILPIIYQEPFLSGEELHEAEEILGDDVGRNLFGLGDLTPEIFFSPSKPTILGPGVGLVWGAGPGLSTANCNVRSAWYGKVVCGPGICRLLECETAQHNDGLLDP